MVALLAEGVDRNGCTALHLSELPSSPSSRRAWIEITGAVQNWKVVSVALLAEGVDRNQFTLSRCPATLVALLAEGVDRNSMALRMLPILRVALLAEGVDRNRVSPSERTNVYWSPSSRRAWIEIPP